MALSSVRFSHFEDRRVLQELVANFDSFSSSSLSKHRGWVLTCIQEDRKNTPPYLPRTSSQSRQFNLTILDISQFKGFRMFAVIMLTTCSAGTSICFAIHCTGLQKTCAMPAKLICCCVCVCLVPTFPRSKHTFYIEPCLFRDFGYVSLLLSRRRCFLDLRSPPVADD